MSANYVRNPSRSVVRHSKKELMPSIAWPLKEIWRLYVFGFIRPLFRELESWNYCKFKKNEPHLGRTDGLEDPGLESRALPLS